VAVASAAGADSIGAAIGAVIGAGGGAGAGAADGANWSIALQRSAIEPDGDAGSALRAAAGGGAAAAG
jgi:hypothetical protein